MKQTVSTDRRSLAGTAPLLLSEGTSPVSQWHEIKIKALTEKQATSGQKILTDMVWDAPTFGPISFADGHWDNPEVLPRTLAWQIHQLKFFPDLLAHDHLNSSTDGREKALAMALEWWERFQDSPTEKANPAWHDHASALRLSNLLLLRSHLGAAKNLTLEEMCREHAAVLKREDFYERGNNHGFDQSIVLFEYGHEVDDVEAKKISRDRIQFEISNAFASDGGHIENSTGYQNFGISQLKHADDISVAYTGQTFGVDSIRERAELVLAHMIRPDRLLPHIGDTANFTARRLPTPATNDLVLPESGWCFFRSGWDTQALQCAFKSGYHSAAHRHDDDLALSIFALGEEWVIDGGMFAHQPKDPMRIYMRSANAHSLPYVVGIPASREITSIGPNSRIISSRSTETTFEVTGETHMWRGYIARRTITYDRVMRKITMRDKIEPVSNQARERVSERLGKGYPIYGTRFLIPEDKQVSRTPQGVAVVGRGGTLNLRSRVACDIVSGRSAPTIAGWRSTVPNTVVPAFDVSFHVYDRLMDETYALSWDSQST